MDQTQYHITHPTHGILKTREYYKHQSCPCQLCKVFLPQVDFIGLEIWSRSRFNVGEFERLDCIIFFVITTENQKLTDV